MRSIPSLLLCLAAAAPLGAQNVGGAWSAVSLPPGAPGDLAGTGLAALGDLDGDGVPDLAVGLPGADPGGLTDAGSVVVFSGATGAVIRRYDGTAAGDQFGYALAAPGDMDGDQVPDLVVGVPYADPAGRQDAGEVRALSGATGAVLWTAQGQDAGGRLGFSVCIIPNADGDGIPDVGAGAPNARPFQRPDAGIAYAFAGATGWEMSSTFGRAPGDRLGFAVAGVPDMNGDGLDELLIGAPFTANGTKAQAGEVRLLEPWSGRHLTSIYGTRTGGRLGQSVAYAGDVDLDGVPDLLAGGPMSSFPGRSEAGLVALFSGATSDPIAWWTGNRSGNHLGWAVAGPGDVNGDGVPDILMSAPHSDGSGTDSGRVDLVSGYDLTLLWRQKGSAAGDAYGMTLGTAGDPDLNGLPGFLVGSPLADPGGLADAGEVELHQYEPFLHASGYVVDSSAGGTIHYDLDFPGSEAGKPYQMLASASGTGPEPYQGILVPLTQDFVFDRVVQNQYPPGLFPGATGTLNAAGDATASLVVPPGGLAKFIGSFLYFAAISHESSGAGRLSSGYVLLRVRR